MYRSDHRTDMAAKKYIFLCFVSLYACFTAALECGPNEIEDDCPTFCKSYSCPRSERESLANQTCEKPDPCPKPSCKTKCRFNYRRSSNRSCILTRDCPPFDCSSKPNQVFDSCPVCPNVDCSRANPNGTCPKTIGRIGIVLECHPMCRCKDNYWIQNGHCVSYAECRRADGNTKEKPKEKEPPKNCEDTPDSGEFEDKPKHNEPRKKSIEISVEPKNCEDTSDSSE